MDFKTSSIGVLFPYLKEQLLKIEPSRDVHTCYFPCQVTLRDGSMVDRVYVAPEGTWGIDPLIDSSRHIDIRQVVKIQESPSRFPVEFAKILYRNGESGMGYTLFALVLNNGSIVQGAVGNSYDFIDMPTGISSQDIVDVLPHHRLDKWTAESKKPYAKQAEFKWCFYGGRCISDIK